MTPLQALSLRTLAQGKGFFSTVFGKYQVMHLLRIEQGLSCGLCAQFFAVGFSCGAVAAWVIDRRLKEEKSFTDYPKLISQTVSQVSTLAIMAIGVLAPITAGVLAPIVVGIAVGVDLLALADRVNNIFLTAIGVSISLAAGFVAGIKMAEYSIDRSDHRIAQLAQVLKKKMDQDIEWRLGDGLVFCQLKLSDYSSYFKRLDLKKLLIKFQQGFNPAHGKEPVYLSLSDMDLTDSDLKRLGEAGWFEGLKTLDLSNNPLITAKGLSWVGNKCSQTLEGLNLSCTNLADDDLRQMAELGYFNQLEGLILGENPRLSGEGLAWMAEKGFKGLKRLDLSGNSQVLKRGLREWLKKEGFENLEILNLSMTDIIEEDLEKMIREAKWFRKLKGLALQRCCCLKKFPSNILELKELDDYSLNRRDAMHGGRFYFQGLFFQGCENLTYTQEILQLDMARKVLGWGVAGSKRLYGLKFPKEWDLERVCKFHKVPFRREPLICAF